MKKLILLALLPINILAQTPGNTQTISDITSIQYIDFDNDVMSSSNVSVGFLGDMRILSYNLTYEWGSEKATNGIFVSNTPFFKYTKVGYSHSRYKTIKNIDRTTSYGVTVSAFADHSAVAISPYFNQIYKFKNNTKLGYTLFIRDNTHDDFYLFEEFYPAASYTKYSVMFIAMKEFEYKRFVLGPELFLLSSIRTHYFNLDDFEGALDIWYWNDFNLNGYYGSSIKYKLTDKFMFGAKLRSCYTYSPSDKTIGFRKATPYIFSIGANYDF
jgi:hypothetical protein